MSIDAANFEELSETDLSELKTAQVPEGMRIEYKLKNYGNSGAEKREFLKDISALANTQGGHLILGISETSGVATDIIGIENIDPDAEILRLDQISKGGLEPRIPGLRMKAVPLDNGNHVIVLRAPRSWNSPHRVIAQGSNKFYLRSSAGVYEPSVEELRTLFSEQTTALKIARDFRNNRISQIRSGDDIRPLEGFGRLILHIVPVASISGALTIDVELAQQQLEAFRPISSMGYTPRFNYLGFINERGGEKNQGYTQVFRNGSLEATKANIKRERDGKILIPGVALEQYFFEQYNNYIIGLRDIGVPPPLIIMLTLEGVLRTDYAVRRNEFSDPDPPLPVDILTLPECFLEDFGDEIDHHRAIKPAFDALWNAIGYPSCQTFNDDGLWVGR
jgi:hypothetical protein